MRPVSSTSTDRSSPPARVLGLLVLCVLLVGLAGCPGLAGESGSSPPADDASHVDPTATAGAAEHQAAAGGTGTGDDGDGSAGPGETATAGDGSVRTLADDHPYLSDGSLDVEALVTAHVDALRSAESFTLSNNATARYAGNDSLAGRFTDVRRFGLSAERLSAVQRSTLPDGTVASQSGRYENATASCIRFGGEVDCADGGFDRGQAIGLTVETTGLETVAGPAFSPDGTVERDGRALYRYTATSLRSSLDESTRSELGPNPSLRSATLLVAPDGRIVEYRFVLERDDGENARAVLDRTYATRAVGSTTVAPPSWLPS